MGSPSSQQRIVRYPLSAESTDSLRYVTFRAFQPVYSNKGVRLRNQELVAQRDDGVGVLAIYLPAGYTINDAFDYEVASEGIMGAALERIRGTTANNGIDERDIERTLTLAAKDVLKAANQRVLKSFSGNVTAQLTRGFRIAPNPRNFTVFSGPTFRTFSFSFEFIPSNEAESNAAIEIVRYFRNHSYPGYQPGTVHYDFPEYFRIGINPAQGAQRFPRHNIIQIPECVCTSVQTTYNPNSHSYFRQNNRPTQINLSVSFTEIEMNTQKEVEKGL